MHDLNGDYIVCVFVVGAQVLNGNDSNESPRSKNIYWIIFLVQFNFSSF